MTEDGQTLLKSGFKLNASTWHNLWEKPACLVNVLQHMSSLGLTSAFGDCPFPYKGPIWQSRVPYFCKHWSQKL